MRSLGVWSRTANNGAMDLLPCTRERRYAKPRRKSLADMPLYDIDFGAPLLSQTRSYTFRGGDSPGNAVIPKGDENLFPKVSDPRRGSQCKQLSTRCGRAPTVVLKLAVNRDDLSRPGFFARNDAYGFPTSTVAIPRRWKLRDIVRAPSTGRWVIRRPARPRN